MTLELTKRNFNTALPSVTDSALGIYVIVILGPTCRSLCMHKQLSCLYLFLRLLMLKPYVYDVGVTKQQLNLVAEKLLSVREHVNQPHKYSKLILKRKENSTYFLTSLVADHFMRKCT